jgi:hypothetical protein
MSIKESEVREAVEYFKDGSVSDHIKNLLILAEAWLARKMPEKKSEHGSAVDAYGDRAKGWNACLYSCRLSSLVSEEEIKKLAWEKCPDIYEWIEDYELRGDEGDYTPSRQEKLLMEDMAHGLSEEIIDNVAHAIAEYVNGGGI